MKAIETRIYGRRFRSRLEARWAVFFTTLNLKWEYEPEGFDLDGEAYLPDFRVWTPQNRVTWYEVKPAHVEVDGKFEKFHAALEASIQSPCADSIPRAMLLSGDPHQFLLGKALCPRCGFVLNKEDVQIEKDESWFNCWECDWETPSGGGHAIERDGFCGLEYRTHKGWLVTTPQATGVLMRTVERAIRAALSARFEHGEGRNYPRSAA